MDLRNYIYRHAIGLRPRSRGRQNTYKWLAEKIGMSPSYLNLILVGKRPTPVKYCLAIEQATGCVVTRKDLRPNDWQTFWPELDRNIDRSFVQDCEASNENINRARMMHGVGRVTKLSDALAFFEMPLELSTRMFADGLPITKERCAQYQKDFAAKGGRK